MTKRTFLSGAFGAALPLLRASGLQAQSPGGESQQLPAATASGSILTQVAGRVIMNLDGTVDVIEYFLWVEGLGADVFAGPPSERTAHFTLRADRLRPILVQNGDMTHLSFQPAGTEGLYRVFFDPSPSNRDFNRPETFSSGTQIAAFKSRRTQATVSPGSSGLVTGTFDLVASREITYRDLAIDIAALLKSGTFSFHTRPVALADFGITTLSIPFGGHIVKAG